MHYWGNFARDLNPNDPNDDAVIWLPFQPNNDYMDLNIYPIAKSSAGMCSFWGSISYDFSENFWPALIDGMNANVKVN